MKFKVGDRVKLQRVAGTIGTIVEVNTVSDYPFEVKWDNGVSGVYRAGALELVQPKTPEEPVPGKFYRTRGGDKVLFTGIHSHYWMYVLLTSAPSIVRYDRAFEYKLKGNDLWDIVDEWTDKVTLPAMEIKRWYVMQALDCNPGLKRGDVLANFLTRGEAEDNWALSADEEIVEVTITLPKRLM